MITTTISTTPCIIFSSLFIINTDRFFSPSGPLVGINTPTIPACATWNQTGITVAGNENGTSGSDLGSFSAPMDIFIDNSYTLFVVDGNNNRVIKYYANAVSGILVIGNLTSGSSSSQFNQPKGITIDHKGALIIGDTANYRIQKFACGSAVSAFFFQYKFLK
jgi:hypothetical protein